MKYQVLISLRNNEKRSRLLSAAVMISSLRVNIYEAILMRSGCIPVYFLGQYLKLCQRCMGTHPHFSAIFSKENNYCDFFSLLP